MLINIIIFISIIIILYLLVIMPKLRCNPGFKAFDGWLYAHRGLHDNKSEAPENSLKAFKLAVDNHYGIELDVQLTKDQVPVIMHDYNLKRACGIDKKIADCEYSELRDCRLFGSQEKIPTFMEALELIDGQVPLIIELKIPWSPVNTCNIASKILEGYKGLYCIESFNPFGLIWYRKHCPKVIRGQLATDFTKEKIDGSRVQYFILKHLLFNFYTKPDFIAYHHKYKKGLSFNICRKIYRTKTVAWTIQSQEDYRNSLRYYNLFIFDSFIPKT